MSRVPGYRLLIESLQRCGTDVLFFLEGGPLLEAAAVAGELGIRCVDVRHEQAAAMAAQAWSRLTRRVGVCMAASGPATCNLVTGVANAFIDGVPLVVIGGAVSTGTYGRGEFQDIDQVRDDGADHQGGRPPLHHRAHPGAGAERVSRRALGPAGAGLSRSARRRAVPRGRRRTRSSGRISISRFRAIRPTRRGSPPRSRCCNGARRPIVLSGTGALFAGRRRRARQISRDDQAAAVHDAAGSRHRLGGSAGHTPVTARSKAFKEADLILAVGTRLNFIFGFAKPPRFAKDAKIIHIDIDPIEIARHPNVAVRLQGDAAAVLERAHAGDQRRPAQRRQRLAHRTASTATRASRRRRAASNWRSTRSRSIRCGCAPRSPRCCPRTRCWRSTATSSSTSRASRSRRFAPGTG